MFGTPLQNGQNQEKIAGQFACMQQHINNLNQEQVQLLDLIEQNENFSEENSGVIAPNINQASSQEQNIQNQELKKENEMLKSQITSLQAKLHLNQAQIGFQDMSLSSQNQKEFQEVSEERNKLKTQIQSFQNELNKIKEEKEQLKNVYQKVCADRGQEKKMYENELNQLRQQQQVASLNQVTSSFENLQNQFENQLKVERFNFQKKVEQLEMSLQMKNQENFQYQNQIALLNNQIGNLNNQCEELQKSCQNLNQSNNKNEEIETLQQNLNELRKERINLLKSLKKQQDQINEYEQKIEQISNKKEQFEKQIQQDKQEIQLLQTKYQDKVQEKELLQIQFNQVNQKLTENSKNQTSQSDQVGKLQQEVILLKQNLYDAKKYQETIINQLKQEKYNEQETQKKQFLGQQTSLDIHLQEKNEKIKSLQDELKNEKYNSQQLQGLNQKLSKDIEILNQELNKIKQQGVQNGDLDIPTQVIKLDNIKKCQIPNCENQNLIKIAPCNNIVCDSHLFTYIQNQTNGYVVAHQNEKGHQIKCNLSNCKFEHSLTQEELKWACGKNFNKYFKFASLRQQYVVNYAQNQFCQYGTCQKSKTEFFKMNCCQSQICTTCAFQIMLVSEKCFNQQCNQPIFPDQIECLHYLNETQQIMMRKTEEWGNQRKICIFCKNQNAQSLKTQLSCNHYACTTELTNFILSKVQQNCTSEQDLSCSQCKQAIKLELIQQIVDNDTYQRIVAMRQNYQTYNYNLYNKQVQGIGFNQAFSQPNPMPPPCQKCTQQTAICQIFGMLFCQNCKLQICENCGQQRHNGVCSAGQIRYNY